MQVQVAVVAALAVAWFAVWRLVRPWDSQVALVFFPSGDLARLGVCAAMVWAIAAACALLTLSARPEGALLAALAGAAGLALRSGSMSTLLKYSGDDFHRTFALLSAEVLAMAGIVIGAAVVIAVIRALARRIVPGWVWSEPPEPAPAAGSGSDRRKVKAAGVVNFAGCLVTELAAALILLALTFRSPERGQIAFALVASFLLAALAAHQMFPVRSAAPFWLGPLLMGAAVLALGTLGASDPGPAWYHAIRGATGMPLRAASPLHWLGLGCGGAVAGFWLSRRIHDHSHEKKEPEKS
ncbi:MAG: hypothetical protein AMJ81_02935 [Phycisphaerae bacterium SM23_33]|nr:MAG: hypothetical protein AMJ81_02935 [Phycisphaerae bacterium SM23_33]